jgi:hypothetical protein
MNLIVCKVFFTGSTAPLGPGLLFFSFMIILQTVGLLGRVISPSQGLYRNTGQHKHRINTYIYQTSMPFVGFEPMIPASERAKTVHALDCSTTVTGAKHYYSVEINGGELNSNSWVANTCLVGKVVFLNSDETNSSGEFNYETPRFVTVFTRGRYWTSIWRSTTYAHTQNLLCTWRSSVRIRLFAWGLSAKILYAFIPLPYLLGIPYIINLFI